MVKLATLAWSVVGCFGLALTCPAVAQNGSSFIDSPASMARYTVAPARPQMACTDLLSLSDAALTLLTARLVPAADDAPEHCRVAAVISPEVRIEINLPTAWNRRFYMSGNGGFAGETPETLFRPLYRAAALRQGFATATTNTGHDASEEPLASFANHNLQKRVDYAFRAVHLTAVTAKHIAARYFGRPPAFSYWDGCSTGGRQGLMEAQRFPHDFDGILAGAPVLRFVDTITSSLWNGKVLAEAPVPLEKLKLVSDAVYALCDAKDGLKDGLIDDPRQCHFDPARDVRQCAAGNDSADCLTAAQTEAIKKVYSGYLSNGQPQFVGFEPGGEVVGTHLSPPLPSGQPESGWAMWLVVPPGQVSRQLAFGETFMKYFAVGRGNPNYDWHSFDFDKDPARLDELRSLLDADNPDLSAFRGAGGKLLMYFGWADTALPPQMGVDYYEKVLATNGAGTTQFMRLFMVPGMFHCRGGIGTDRFDAMTPLIDWVETGAAPEKINAARVDAGKVVRTRPLCPYPQVARYAGSGSPDEAANFVCKIP
jgi:Tannase and feruloyl esterase